MPRGKSTDLENPTHSVDLDTPIISLDNDFVPESWDDVREALGTEGLTELLVTWRPINKDDLIDTPFLIVNYQFHKGNFGEFVAVRLMTEDNERYFFVDGGSGICSQLSEMVKLTGRMAGIVVSGGLRKSEYPFDNDLGIPVDPDNPKQHEGHSIGTAATHYIAA